VIHTVGPIWRGGTHGEPELLAGCYRESLALAVVHSVQSIAFPAISCGIYGYPIPAAAKIAINTTHGFLAADRTLTAVIFACFHATALHALQAAMER
jgi:O-acetyl-ADP-ribose deacetylase